MTFNVESPLEGGKSIVANGTGAAFATFQFLASARSLLETGNEDYAKAYYAAAQDSGHRAKLQTVMVAAEAMATTTPILGTAVAQMKIAYGMLEGGDAE